MLKTGKSTVFFSYKMVDSHKFGFKTFRKTFEDNEAEQSGPSGASCHLKLPKAFIFLSWRRGAQV